MTEFAVFRISLPWRYRSGLAFRTIHAYEPCSSLYRDYGEYLVPLGDRDTLKDDPYAISHQLDGYGAAWAALVEGDSFKPPVRASSRFRPWVMPMGGLTFDAMEETLKRCKLANVGPDHFFEGRDLVIHVRPFIGQYKHPDERHARTVGGFGLLGIEAYPCADWNPIPNYRRAE